MIFPQVKQAYFEEGELVVQNSSAGAAFSLFQSRFFRASASSSCCKARVLSRRLATVGLIANITLVASGSLLLMWLGELVTEFGIGNGVSLIILAGILARLPRSHRLKPCSPQQQPTSRADLGFIALALAMIYAVVVVSDAERSIPIAYARAYAVRLCHRTPPPIFRSACFRPA
jgi:preprotein translocase subunit SecY